MGHRELTSEERDVLAAARAMGGHSHLFPGFDPASIPFALWTSEDRVLLFRHPAPPAGFRRLDDELWEGPVAGVSAATSRRIGERWCAVIPTVYAKQVEPWRLNLVCLHEAFHAYQGAVWPPLANVGPWVEMNPIAAAYCRLEMAALDAGLELDKDHQAESELLARQFLAARRARRREMTVDVSPWEQAAELFEGIPHWLEGRAVPERREWWKAYIRETLSLAGGPVHQTFKGPWYRSGAAMCHLLELLAPTWSSRVPAASLEELLLEAAGASEATRPSPALIEEEDQKRRAWEGERDRTLADFAEAEVLALTGLEFRTFDPLNSRRLDGDRMVHTRALHLAGDWGELVWDRGIPGCLVEAVLTDTLRKEVRWLPRGVRAGPGFRLRLRWS